MTEVDELFQTVPSDPDQVLERVAFLRQYLVEHPDSALAWAMLGATSVMHLDRGENLRCYERAHELEPNELGWLWGIARNTRLGQDPRTAFEVLRRLPWIPGQFGQFDRDFYYVELGAEAIPLLRQWLLLEPRNPTNWIELGWCLLRQDLKDEAKAAFDQASRQLAEQWSTSWELGDRGVIQSLIEFSRQGYRLALGYERLEHTEGCLREARLALDAWQVVRWTPYRQERSLVDILEVNHCFEDVARYCEVAFTIEERFCGSFKSAYVWALVGMGNVDAALDFYRTRMDGDEGVRSAALHLAGGLRTAGRQEEAVQLLDEWLPEMTNSDRYSRYLLPNFWHEVASVREALGDEVGAQEARERAAEAEERLKE